MRLCRSLVRMFSEPIYQKNCLYKNAGKSKSIYWMSCVQFRFFFLASDGNVFICFSSKMNTFDKWNFTHKYSRISSVIHQYSSRECNINCCVLFILKDFPLLVRKESKKKEKLNMQREEKQRESMLESLQTRLNDLKISIGGMIHKIETEFETINWPTFLDNFALISSHVNAYSVGHWYKRSLTLWFLIVQLTGLTKILSHEMGTPLRNLTVLPLLLSPERDEALLQLTEGRISVFSHDMVPDYLRTKPEPTAEQRMLQHEQKVRNEIFFLIKKWKSTRNTTFIAGKQFDSRNSEQTSSSIYQSGVACIRCGEQSTRGMGSGVVNTIWHSANE